MAVAGEQSRTMDVAVVGGGPAGRWLAALLVRRGMSVAVVDPRPERGWEKTYGLWVDEVEDLTIKVDFDGIWSSPTVRVGALQGGAGRQLSRAYGRIDNGAFRRRLDEIIAGGRSRQIAGEAREVRYDEQGAALVCADGPELRCALVVDASGGAARLVDYEAEQVPAVQTAYGLDVKCSGDPLRGAAMVLMDYSPPAPAVEQPAIGAPSFLYGMARGGDRYFVEETVLMARPAVPVGRLKEALYRRLGALDIEVLERYGEERCEIPMGTALPVADQPTLAFGAAAGFVHPATGYQMARMLRAGPMVADAIADGLHDEREPAEVSRRCWEVMWPASRRRARRLLLFGMDALCGFERRAMSRFFDAFFELSTDDWGAYMSGESGAGKTAKIMWRLFRRAPMEIRLALARHILSSGGELRDALRPMARRETAPRGREKAHG